MPAWMRRWVASVSSSSLSWECRCSREPWLSSSSSAGICCRTGTARRCRQTSAATPGHWSSNTGSPPACISSGCGVPPPVSERRPPPSTCQTFPDLQLVALLDGDTAAPLRRTVLAESDYLLLRGDAEAAGAFASKMHLSFRDEKANGINSEETLFNRRSGLAEVVIPPRSGL